MHRFQRHRELGAGVGAGPRATTEARLRPTGPTPPAAEQALEEITEASAGPTSGEDLLEVDAPGRATKTTRRRLDVVAGTIAAGTQLVVGSAFLRVAQRLVGLVDGLEALLGVGLLADVGVELARQPAIGGLDLGLARAGLQPEDVVVVLELHLLLRWWAGAHGAPVRHMPCRHRVCMDGRDARCDASR